MHETVLLPCGIGQVAKCMKVLPLLRGWDGCNRVYDYDIDMYVLRMDSQCPQGQAINDGLCWAFAPQLPAGRSAAAVPLARKKSTLVMYHDISNTA